MQSIGETQDRHLKGPSWLGRLQATEAKKAPVRDGQEYLYTGYLGARGTAEGLERLLSLQYLLHPQGSSDSPQGVRGVPAGKFGKVKSRESLWNWSLRVNDVMPILVYFSLVFLNEIKPLALQHGLMMGSEFASCWGASWACETNISPIILSDHDSS